MSCRNPADDVSFLSQAFKKGEKLGELLFPDDEGKTDAQVEDFSHFALVNAPVTEKGKYGGTGPGVVVKREGKISGNDPPDVVIEPPAGDVGHAPHESRAGGLEGNGDIQSRGDEETLADGFSLENFRRVGKTAGIAGREKGLPDEGKTVAVNSRTRNADDGVAGGDTAPVDNFILPEHADGKTRKIESVFVVGTGHFRSFSPEEGTPAVPAGPGRTFHDGAEDFGFQPSAGDVVQEEEGPGAVWAALSLVSMLVIIGLVVVQVMTMNGAKY